MKINCINSDSFILNNLFSFNHISYNNQTCWPYIQLTLVLGRDNEQAFTCTTMSYLSGIGSASWNMQYYM